MGTIGSRLKEFREHLNLSQEDFADKCGVTQGNITQWETNTVKPARKLSLIINAYPELNIDWLMNGTGQMIKNLNDRSKSNNTDVEALLKYVKKLETELKERDAEIKSLQSDIIALLKNK
jgi:transcriptional regulator with XRE-family HTH domain